MGVIVQRQVDAVAAGVLFTSTTDGAMLVEYTAGLGDALVAGAIDPGRITIDRETGRARPLPSAPQAFELNSQHAQSLHRIGLAVEREFGAPQDVEWSLSRDGTMYVVQSRPITAPVTIGSVPAFHPSTFPPFHRVSWSNANVNENFPAPISPLLFSIAAAGYTHYFRNLARAFGIAPRRVRAMEPAFQQIIGVHGARMYYNLTSIHSVLRLAPFGKALTGSFDSFVGADGNDVRAETTATSGTLRQVGEVAVIAVKTTRQFLRLDKRIARFERTVDEFAARTDPAVLPEMSLGELGAALAEFVDIRCHKWLDASLADTASMVCYGALERLLRRAGRGAVHTSLLKAIPGVASGEPVLHLWALSRRIRRDPALAELIEHCSAAEAVDAIEASLRFIDFRAALHRYLDDWGFRCSEELMLTSPSFGENPAPAIDILRAYARLDGDSPTEALRAQAAEREAETERVLRELNLIDASLLRVLLPWTHAAIRFRERARLKQALLYSRCRRIALALGDELSRRGTIAARDDVFFLTAPELLELARGGAMLPGSVRETIGVRRVEHARLSAFTPPDAFTLGRGEYFDPTKHGRNETVPTGNDLTGIAACSGRVTGRATVLASVTEADRLAKGDILVTKQTDPGWGPVFFMISGLVIERGGMLSHGAIIAREFGIPCVVGVRSAMERIPSGATITVDGDRGAVYVVD
jgi:pyruvate,water dikinase